MPFGYQATHLPPSRRGAGSRSLLHTSGVCGLRAIASVYEWFISERRMFNEQASAMTQLQGVMHVRWALTECDSRS